MLSDILDFKKIDFIFLAAVRHLGFLKIYNFNGQQDYEGERVKFRGNRSNRCRDMAIFDFSQNGGLPTSSIFNFSNVFYGELNTLQGVNMCTHTKFRCGPSNRC